MLAFADSSSRLAANVVLIPDREPAKLSRAPFLPAVRRSDMGVAGPMMEEFRIQYLGAGPAANRLLKEVEIQAANSAAAIFAASTLDLPPGTIGLRILDGESREVFARAKRA
jgi:hypothetical protein